MQSKLSFRCSWSCRNRDNTNIPLYERQLQETNTKIRNLINAIQQGVLTKSTKESLEELEAAKEELETRLANEQLSKPPKISAEFMTFWLHRFRKLDVTKQSHRKMLIDTFINAIYLYDDKMLITFNYKDGTKKITFSEIQEASKRDASGSDLECSPAPSRNRHAPQSAARPPGTTMPNRAEPRISWVWRKVLSSCRGQVGDDEPQERDGPHHGGGHGDAEVTPSSRRRMQRS